MSKQHVNNKKNQLIISEGCTDTLITINGKTLEKIPLEEKKKFLHQIIDELNDDDIDQKFLDMENTSIAEYKSYGTCEQCGQWLCDWIINF